MGCAALNPTYKLRIKLSIVLVAILPLVLMQFYIFETIVKRAFITRMLIDEAISLYDKFSKVALIICFIAVSAAAALGEIIAEAFANATEE